MSEPRQLYRGISHEFIKLLEMRKRLFLWSSGCRSLTQPQPSPCGPFGRGSAFAGRYVGPVSEADQDLILAMVEQVQARESDLHKTQAPAERDTADFDNEPL